MSVVIAFLIVGILGLVLGLGSLLVLDDLFFSLEQGLFFEGLGLTLCIAD